MRLIRGGDGRTTATSIIGAASRDNTAGSLRKLSGNHREEGRGRESGRRGWRGRSVQGKRRLRRRNRLEAVLPHGVSGQRRSIAILSKVGKLQRGIIVIISGVITVRVVISTLIPRR